MDFGKMEVKYFYAEGWTGVIGLKLLREIGVLARQIFDTSHSPMITWPPKRLLDLEGGRDALRQDR